MHLKVFLKLKKPYKLSLPGKYIKNPKKPKKTTGLFFLNKKPGFFPTLPVLALCVEAVALARPGTAGPARPLIGVGLRHREDLQRVHTCNKDDTSYHSPRKTISDH